MRAEDDAFKLRANTFHGNMRQLVTLAQQSAPSIFGDGKIKHRSEAHTSQHAQRILLEAFLRITHTADQPALRILLSAIRINQNAIQAAAHRIDREITAAEILLHITYK
ncbi:hypothetical protein D3C76_306530 [compost metagenome]